MTAPLLPDRFSWRYCQKQRLLPRRREGNLLVLACPAGEHPGADSLATLAQHLGCELWVEPEALPAWERSLDELRQSQAAATGPADDSGDWAAGSGPAPGDDPLDELADREALDRMARQAPVVALVNELCRAAILAGASDLHLESRFRSAQARMRLDGRLVLLRELDPAVFGGVASRIKVMANLNIMERRLPQDGRLRFDLGNRRVDLRVSILPGSHGESLVLRILGTEADVPELAGLGLAPSQLGVLEAACRASGGLVLLAGPTGSGKTTTLHALLRRCRDPGLRILTLEDPVERVLEGITQIPVNEDAGLGFATLLRRVLRHDPDVIMVGEIRDEATAALACRAALTGHLVLSTVHATSALGALDRLKGLGVDASLLGAGLKVIASQRLVRRLCPGCRQGGTPDPAARALLERRGLACERLYVPVGCPACGGSGYAGRSALWEVLPMTEGLAAGLGRDRPVRELESLVDRLSFPGLELAAQAALAEGLTSLDEAWREVLG